MNCKKIQSKLLEYSAKELPGELDRAFDTHIKTCSVCQKELEGLKRTMNLFDQLPQIDLQPEQQQQFLSEVRQKIRSLPKVKPVRYRWKWLLPRLIPAAVAASILIFFVTMRLKSSDNKYAEMASNIFTSPSLSLSGEFVSNYFKTNSNETALKEELSQLSPNAVDEIENYLTNQLEVNDLVEDMTEGQKTQLEKKIKEML